MHKSCQGQLLIAVPELMDPNFVRTVVLVVEHTEQGALGLVLNRPLDLRIEDAWKKVSSVPCRCSGPLYYGGPCQGPLMVLHTQAHVGQIEVLPGLYFSTEQDKLEWLVEHNQGPIKFFVGYSGWAPGQLDAEMEAGGWYLLPATPQQVFGPGGESQWTKLTIKLALGNRIADHIIPEDPRNN